MVRLEYLNFLRTFDNSIELSAVRKIANLVLNNLDEIAPLTTNQGQRVKKIASLAQSNWSNLSTEIRLAPPPPSGLLKKITKIKGMVVGPFRGFSRQEVFDLDSNLVLIYGPNGTGKTSFCEALEYGLLGIVEDAGYKRFRDQREYLKNAYVNSFIAPIIHAEDSESNTISVEPDERLYRFCFVEKNRIDSFSRIAAQAPAKQSELISTLFGLESFMEFVGNFTNEMDNRYIDLVGKKTQLLHEKRLQLKGIEQQIQDNNKLLANLELEEKALVNQYSEGISFHQMVCELNGNEQIIGKVAMLESETQSVIRPKSNLTLIKLHTLQRDIEITISALLIEQQELTKVSEQVSFKQLYDAIIELKQVNPNECPACLTPLDRTTTNPYTYAKDELLKLQQLSQIQLKIQRLEHQINQFFIQLSQIIQSCLSFYPNGNLLTAYKIFGSEKTNIEWWESLKSVLPNGTTPWGNIEIQIIHLENNDLKIKQEEELREIKKKELVKYREFVKKITILQTRRQAIHDALVSAQSIITNFEIENSQLILEVEIEKEIVATNRLISDSYASFVKKLEEYCNDLPRRLVRDLGCIVVDLYNAFNRNDKEADLIADVKLPVTQNQRMEISFNNDPEKFYDVLHILSEGHIRCLGLAILLAKNLKEESPLLIFDDPVNAIDDEHREAIRRTLFEDNFFTGKQVLLTCHGEEFYKDIYNLLSVERAQSTKSFTFLPRLDEPHINVDFKSPPRNYILAARQHINRNEIRDALAKSRQALEAMTKGKIWKYVSRYGDGNLSLKLRSATSPIELRNLTEQLKSKIIKADFLHEEKQAVLGPLVELLGVNGESREWRYLNKGTHEEQDRAEFDRHTVNTIVSGLERLDRALT